MPIPYDQMKSALLAERAALTDQLNQISVVVREEGVGYSTHPADDATLAFDQARDLAVQQNTQATLRLVEDALVRLDNGTYGLCVDCGAEIDAARLKAIPYAAMCLTCQSKREHR
jgi:DnaK suppressor protein